MATNEATLNGILDRSFKRTEFHHKIQDATGGQGLARPFDSFCTFKGLPTYYETKILKKYEAFGFASRVEDHQWDNLRLIDSKLSVENNTWIVLGIYELRKSFRVFFFDMKYLWNLKECGVKSIKKKELEQLVEKGLYLDIKGEEDKQGKRKQYIQDLHLLKEKIIY